MPFDRSQPVLVIDDSPVMTRIVKELLHQIGIMDVDVALSPQLGLDRLAERRYGLVICDWFMPPYTGGDLQRAMQTRADLAAIPVLLITTQADRSNPGPRNGPALEDMVVKPFNAVTLAAKIDALVGRRAA
jgi:two-component system, chemotaxis family, chemotaxis protein CheY